ncbi:MAG: hypothetical protein WC959_04170 [Kiritimatiellales bacterium]
MKKITPEEFTAEVQAVCGGSLQSAVLYGSAAAGDRASKGSDYNILLVMNDLSAPVLRALSKPVSNWERAGNPPPMLFTRKRLFEAADIFPIEFLDMKDARRILFGDDIIAEMNVDPANLRLQVERELRVALIQLRRNYLAAAGGNHRRLAALMTGSFSGIMSVFHAALRLYETPAPLEKIAALEKLNAHVPLKMDGLKKIRELKNRTVKIKMVDVERLFEEYLKSIELLVDAVDKLV